MIGQLKSNITNYFRPQIQPRNQNVPRQNTDMDDPIHNQDTRNEFEFKYNQPVHPFLSCTKEDALVAVYSYYVRHNISWVALEHLCDLINFILGNDALPRSKYLLKQFFNNTQNKITPTVHLECLSCKNYLGERSELCQQKNVMCNVCKLECPTDIKYLKNHFVTLPIKPQLVQVLNENIKNGRFIWHRQTHTQNIICDMHDGEIYRNLKNKMRDSQFITLTMSTDGAIVHKSPKDKSLWPIQLTFNEVELKYRFRRENIICAAFSYGKTPDMSVLMKALILELNEINRNGGIEITMNEHGEIERFFVCLIAITTDSMAKPYVAKISQHNAHEGCPYCYHYGSIPDGSKTVKYSVDLNAECRTHEQSKAAMIEADRSEKRVRGYTGISPVLALDTPFDVVWQFVVDKMHSIDLGVIKKIFDLLMDKRNKSEP